MNVVTLVRGKELEQVGPGKKKRKPMGKSEEAVTSVGFER